MGMQASGWAPPCTLTCPHVPPTSREGCGTAPRPPQLQLPAGWAERPLRPCCLRPPQAMARLGLVTTASMRPYSTASCADMKKSRSVSMVICSMLCPVNSAR